MADWPVKSLGDKTLLQYAKTPYMDKLARMGRNGRLITVAEGFHPGSEVANMSVLGYNLPKVYEGRGPLEAASIGYDMRSDDFALRCNIICIADGKIKNHHGGHLTTDDSQQLIDLLNEKLGNDRVMFIKGIQYRHLLIIRGGNKHVTCAPPHDHPNEPSYKVMLGNWLMQHDRKNEAFKWFESALQDDKKNEFALNSLYDYYRNTGDDAKARQLRDDILLSKQTDIKTKLSMLQQAIRENEQEQGGDSTIVLDIFDRVMRTAPHNADLSNLKAVYMRLKKMPQDSINAAYAHTLSFEPDNLSARLTLTQNLWEEKKWNEVVDLCDKGIQYTPEELMFYYFMGLAYVQQDKDAEAYDAFKRGLSAVDLSNADETQSTMASDMYGLIGDISYSNGKYDEAFGAYEEALKMKADNVQVLNNYAYYLSMQNTRLDSAAEMSLKTLKEEPTNATFLDTYAWILFLQKRYDEAKAYIDLTLANDKDPSNVLWEHAGDIYLMTGDKQKAVEYWQKAIESGGDKAQLERKIKTRKLK